MKLREIISKNSIFGDPIAVHGLGVIPFLGDTVPNLPALDLLEQALDGGTFRLTEVSEGGSVPFLRAENSGSKPVLILDGEELVGGKQNRIVNTSLIILPGKVMDIPVSCMEAGRWNRQREGSFRSDHGAVEESSSPTTSGSRSCTDCPSGPSQSPQSTACLPGSTCVGLDGFKSLNYQLL
jgi:hypothetical protein